MKKILLPIIAPLLYARYATLLIVLTCLYNGLDSNQTLFAGFVFCTFYVTIIGLLHGLNTITKLIVWIFRIDYKVESGLQREMKNFGVWEKVAIITKNHRYETEITTMGSNMYNEEEKCRRIAIINYFWY